MQIIDVFKLDFWDVKKIGSRHVYNENKKSVKHININSDDINVWGYLLCQSLIKAERELVSKKEKKKGIEDILETQW